MRSIMMALSLGVAAVVALSGCSSAHEEEVARTAHGELAAIEQRSGGRLGVQVMREDGKVILAYRENEHFAMCSSFKLPFAGAVLEAVQYDALALNDTITFHRSDVISHSPTLRSRLVGDGGTITVEQALEASVMVSDNGATNLVLDKFGGPRLVTRTWNVWQDDVSSLDRRETALNENGRGDTRDTSSPSALAGLIGKMLYGDRLTADHRALLRRWTQESTTGRARFRAGLPPQWAAGDKTGTCANPPAANAEVNDIGWFEIPNGKRYLFVVMLDRPTFDTDASQAAIADVARIAARRITQR